MKRRSIFLGVTFAICISFLFTSSAAAYPGYYPEQYYANLLHGEYCDVDADGEEDDLRIFAEIFTFAFPHYTNLEMYMYLSIEMPSGNCLDFWWNVTVYYLQDFSFEFRVIDGAMEAGWYDTYFFIFAVDEPWYDGDYLSFDPPFNKGNSDPTCEVLVF